MCKALMIMMTAGAALTSYVARFKNSAESAEATTMVPSLKGLQC